MFKRIAAFAAILLGVIGLWAITQSVGALYGHDPRLGGVDLSLLWPGAGRLYVPTAIFAWAWAAPLPWPFAFVVSFGGAVLSSLFAIGGYGFIVFDRWSKETQIETFGADHWGTIIDAVNAGLIMGKGLAPKETPNIVVLGRMGAEFITVTDGGHVIGFGSAGSGKTRTIVIPSLLAWGGSAIVYSAGKLDVWEMTSGFRSEFSDVFLFDLGNENSCRFNPLADIRIGTRHEIDDCNNIANEFLPPKKEGESRKSSDFWDGEGKKLLAAVFLHVRACYVPKDQNIGTAREILMQPVDGVIKELIGSPHPHVAQVASATLLGDDRARDSTLRTAQAFLDPWASEVVQELTSKSDFRISDLMCNEKPMTLYLRIPSDMREEWRPVLKLIISRVVRSILHDEKRMADGRAKKHRLLFNLDEFHSFGFPSWPSDLSEMRSYGGTAIMITQSEKTLEGVYGGYQSISANCRVRLYLDAADPDTQKKISEQIGTATEIRRSEGWSRSSGSFFKTNRTSNEAEQTRAVMDGGAVRMLGRDQMLALITGCKPLKVSKLVDFDRHEPFKSRMKAKAPVIHRREAAMDKPSILEA